MSELVSEGRQQQAGYPPGEEQRSAEELEGELRRSEVRPQTVDDSDEETTHDAEPPERVGLERSIEEWLRDHAYTSSHVADRDQPLQSMASTAGHTSFSSWRPRTQPIYTVPDRVYLHIDDVIGVLIRQAI